MFLFFSLLRAAQVNVQMESKQETCWRMGSTLTRVNQELEDSERSKSLGTPVRGRGPSPLTLHYLQIIRIQYPCVYAPLMERADVSSISIKSNWSMLFQPLLNMFWLTANILKSYQIKSNQSLSNEISYSLNNQMKETLLFEITALKTKQYPSFSISCFTEFQDKGQLLYRHFFFFFWSKATRLLIINS